MMLATSASAARAAATAVAVTYEPPAAAPLLTIQQAKAAGSYYDLRPVFPSLRKGAMPMSVQVGSGVHAGFPALHCAGDV